MMVFWMIAALLIVAALFFLLPPLLKKSQGEDLLDRDELNVTVFKDQLAELERDLSAGVLTQEQYDTARQDLERNFALEAGQDAAQSASQTDSIVGRATAVVILVLVPVLAISLYTLLGSGEPGLNPQQAQVAQQSMTQPENPKQSLQEAVSQLQERLKTNADNIEDWVMLARSHYFLEQYVEASQAFERASTLLGDADPEILADYADALAMANQRNMLGRPYELVKKALSIQPFHEKSLWLAGVAAYQAQDLKATLGYWERLLQIFPEGTEEYQQMLSNVNEVKQTLGMQVEQPIPAPGTATPASITGKVQIDAQLASKVAPTDTVFVFARAVTGPRMPLAILRMQVQDLPTDFTLDDSLAMNPAMQLSNVDQVIVSARISKSGNALPQSGDLEGSVGPIMVRGAQPVTLVINNIVP